MAEKSKAIKLTTPRFRVSFPNLHAPRAFEGQEPKYSVVMLFPKSEDMGWLKTKLNEAMIARFGADKSVWPKGLRNPIRDGDEKESPLKGYEGMFYVTAKSKDKPGVVDSKNQDILDVKEAVYSGCYARATIALAYYDRAGNKGIGVYLNNLQKLGEGERLGGKRDAKNDFDPVEEGPAAGGDKGDDEMFT